MIDLHCHLLPQVDDGPGSLAGALEMCRSAVADGITHAVTTPHIHPGRWDNEAETIALEVETLRCALQAESIPLQLGFAGEVRLSDQLPLQVERNVIPFYGELDGFRVMLLEFPHGHIPPGSAKLAEWLLARGIRPLIAHPERNKQVMKSIESIYPFVDMGCWLQVTASSVSGGFGKPAMKAARHLLQNDLVTVVASDAHNLRSRPPGLSQAFDLIARDYGDARAQRLLCDTPAVLIEQQFRNTREFSTIADGH